ncbi:OsmC family peroxiredoxin, partial [Sulfobacillus sp. DSM 109850]|nr:OsmC family peroxiredoxin [Sulfobacillus harzensis]
IQLTGVRHDQPPQLVSVTYPWTVQTDAAEDRLRRLVETAKRNSTVYQTLALAIPVSGTVVRDDGALPI